LENGLHSAAPDRIAWPRRFLLYDQLNYAHAAYYSNKNFVNARLAVALPMPWPLPVSAA
jgi:hypothetical protein